MISPGGHCPGPSEQMSSPPNRAVKMTRNMRGNAKVKKALAGFRQNALFV
jgi:hypothetical protein